VKKSERAILTLVTPVFYMTKDRFGASLRSDLSRLHDPLPQRHLLRDELTGSSRMTLLHLATPDSARGDTSGKMQLRLLAVTAKARSRPPWMSPSVEAKVPKNTGTCPPNAAPSHCPTTQTRQRLFARAPQQLIPPRF
jgi:hypothetical protein